MRIHIPLLAFGGFFLSGCLFSSPVGIWLLEVAVSLQDQEDICVETVTSHNFTGATVVPEEEENTDYTITETNTMSGALVFARIEKSGDGAFMVVDDKVYPGQKAEGEKGTWIFQWVGNDYNAEERNHVDGYNYTGIVDEYNTSTFKLTLDGDTLTGSYTEDQSVYQDYTESDSWSRELALGGPDSGGDAVIIGEWGAIPSRWYLERPMDGPQGGMEQVRNRWETQDCDNEPCKMSVESTCASKVDVVGTRTNFNNDEVYDAIENTGQNPGTMAF